jgi:hypothetical protein
MVEPPDNYRRHRDEVDSDRLFLEDFVKLYTTRPGMLKTKIPNLINMVKQLPMSANFELYTNETCVEYHLLLLELLDSFKTALDSLTLNYKGETVKGSDQDFQQFNELVGNVHRNGYALLRLSRGRAFQIYLENIKNVLKVPHGSNVGASIGKEEEEEEIDEELEAIRSQKGSGGAALVKSFTAWLRLMVGHFDAVEIVVRFVTSKNFQYQSISIELLLAPPTDSALLAWSDLFTSYKCLPKKKKRDGSSDISNTEICDFLTNRMNTALKYKKAVYQARHVQNSWTNYMEDDTVVLNYKTFRSSLQASVKSTNSDLSRVAKLLLDMLPNPSQALLPVSRDKITKEIKLLCDKLILSDRDRFFLSLNNLQFLGTLHCEAFLASLLPAFTQGIPIDNSDYKSIRMILPAMEVEDPPSHFFISSDLYLYTRLMDQCLEFQNVAAQHVQLFSRR